MNGRHRSLPGLRWCEEKLRAHEFARFLIAGAVNTVVTYVIYVGLALVLPYLAAYTVTTAAGILLSYYLNARFVFKQKLRLATALKYPTVYLVQYLCGMVLLYVLVELAHVSKFTAPILIVAVTVPITFLLSRFVIVRR